MVGPILWRNGAEVVCVRNVTHARARTRTLTYKNNHVTFLNLYNRFDMVGHEKEIDSRMVREGDAGHVGPK